MIIYVDSHHSNAMSKLKEVEWRRALLKLDNRVRQVQYPTLAELHLKRSSPRRERALLLVGYRRLRPDKRSLDYLSQ